MMVEPSLSLVPLQPGLAQVSHIIALHCLVAVLCWGQFVIQVLITKCSWVIVLYAGGSAFQNISAGFRI